MYFRGNLGYQIYDVHDLYYGLQDAAPNTNVLESAYKEEWEKKTMETIQKAAYTGNIGDGKIFSYDVRDAMRIRTKETGPGAIQPE